MKIGIFGGAFDPIHIEHIKIIEKSKEELNLEKLILLPSFSPPNKNIKISPFEIRVKMLEAVTKGYDYIYIDKREFENKKTKNCTYKVLRDIIEDNKYDDIIYIIGGDSMIKFHTWVHPEIISKLTKIAVATREGYQDIDKAIINAEKNYNAKIEKLSFAGEDVSSTMIKADYELGRENNFVIEEVSDIIKKEKLYQDYQSLLTNLKDKMEEERFEHCKNTVVFAMKFANRLDLSYNDVFLAAILHDCAKKDDEEGKKIYKNVPQKIVHQFYGADIAKNEYGIENEKILNAIRYHTTGKKNMTKLEKLIYCADMLEEDRDFEGVKKLRETIEKDFEKGFVACIKATIDKLEKSNKDVYYLTKECWEYYK